MLSWPISSETFAKSCMWSLALLPLYAVREESPLVSVILQNPLCTAHKDIIMYHHAQREVPFCGLYSKSFLDFKNGALELVSFYGDDAQFISLVSLKIMCVWKSQK